MKIALNSSVKIYITKKIYIDMFFTFDEFTY